MHVNIVIYWFSNVWVLATHAASVFPGNVLSCLGVRPQEGPGENNAVNPPISPEISSACPSWTAHNVNKSVLHQTVLLMGSANKHGPYLHLHSFNNLQGPELGLCVQQRPWNGAYIRLVSFWGINSFQTTAESWDTAGRLAKTGQVTLKSCKRQARLHF